VCTTVQQTGIMLGIVDALEILELAKRKSESGWQPGGNPTKSMKSSRNEVKIASGVEVELRASVKL